MVKGAGCKPAGPKGHRRFESYLLHRQGARGIPPQQPPRAKPLPPQRKGGMGFHNRAIPKGVYGELSKIREELEEAEDAEAQGIDLMVLLELADILGAVEGVAKRYGMTLDQLRAYASKRSEIAVASLALTGGKSTYGA